MRCRLNKFLQEMQASLRYYDGNNDGLLTKQEVRQALQQCGFTFDDKVFAAVFQVEPLLQCPSMHATSLLQRHNDRHSTPNSAAP